MVEDGLLLVDKPGGWTSHDVVARVRRLARQRRVGHAGTLDPMATGLLVLGLGRATRLLGHLGGSDKDYAATIRLGESTVTDDAESDVTGGAPADAIDEAALVAAMAALTGDIAQRPSSVSAIKVAGVRSHARVRRGQSVELPPRPVRVDSFTLVGRREGAGRDGRPVLDLDVVVTCSAGTYVRALARDLGEALGTGGHLTALRRTRSGCFTVSQAHALEDLAPADPTDPGPAAALSAALLPMAEAVARAFPRWDVSGADAPRVAHGIRLPWPDGLVGDGPVGVFGGDDALLALAENRDGTGSYLAVFT